MIHSRSYTHIIKNLYSDPEDIFSTITTDPRILQSASSVTKAYDDFIREFLPYQAAVDGKWLEKEQDLLREVRYELEEKTIQSYDECKYP